VSTRSETVLAAIQAQHRALVEISLALDAAVKDWKLEEIRAALPKLRDVLDAHVTFENREFYPVLAERSKAAEPSTATLVKLFDDNMKIVADGVNTFLARFAGKPELDREVFTREWKTAFLVLGKRLHDEEKTLHPLFSKLAV
jgi:hypothetical protein